MVVSVSRTDQRSRKALVLFTQAATWTRGHLKDGTPFFVIPGSQGRVYWTNTRDCTCPDRQERAVDCKHMLAVRLYVLSQPAPTRGPRQTSACGLDDRISLTAEGAAALLAMPAQPAPTDDELDAYALACGEPTDETRGGTTLKAYRIVLARMDRRAPIDHLATVSESGRRTGRALCGVEVTHYWDVDYWPVLDEHVCQGCRFVADHPEPTDEDAARLGLATMAELQPVLAGVRADARPLATVAEGRRVRYADLFPVED